MFCPKCGKINPDSGEVCNGCGAALHEQKTEEPEKKKGKVLKVLVALVVVAAVVTAVILLTGCNSSEMPKETMNF